MRISYCEHHAQAREDIATVDASAKSAHIRINGVVETQAEHGRRIVELEKTDIKLADRLDGVCSRLDQLIKAIWGLLAFAGSTVVGVLIWMLQQWLTRTP